MKRCSVRPYTGRGKYIFVSYCPKDKKYVFPIIEQMARDGFNVWYNEGSKSEAGWTETLAGYLGESTICLAVISKNSLNSHDCRKEINYAILKKKQFISVILEPVELSLAMQLQLSGGQSLVKYEFQNNRAFFEKLYESQVIRGCYSEPNPSVIVSRPEDYDDDDEGGKKEIGGITIGIFGPMAKQNPKEGAEEFKSNNEEIERLRKAEEECRKAEEAERLRKVEEERRKAEEAERLRKAEEERRKAEEAERLRKAEEERRKAEEAEHVRKAEEERLKAEAIRIAEEKKKAEEEVRRKAEEEIRRRQSITANLVRVKTGEIINIDRDTFILGRSETKASYTILGNSMIGREHAKIVRSNGEHFIVDNNSLNKTHLNSLTLEPEQYYKLSDGDVIRLANEMFSFHLQK